MKAIQIITGEIIEIDNTKPIEDDEKWIINPTQEEIDNIKEKENE